MRVSATGVAGALSLFGASSAHAATVTLGSPLTNTLPSTAIAFSATVRQSALPGATLVAPFNGQIGSWKVINASGGWTLQVLRPSGGGFASTGSTHGEPLGPGIVSFTARLPIRAGDTIGLASDSASSAIGNSDATPGAAVDLFVPPLTDNTPPRTASASRNREVGFNATILSNCIVPKVKGKSLKKARRKLRAAGCRGKVRRKGGKRVTKQRPPAGTEVPPGTPVKLTLGS